MNHIRIRRFLFILSIYSSINNAHAHLEGEGIIGGRASNPGEYTYQVSLQKGFKNFCGGTIIGNQHVVTAAHCVTDGNGALMQDAIKVIAGVNNLEGKIDPKRVDIDVETVYIPRIYNAIKKWNTQKKYTSIRAVGDIAVLKLDRPFDFKSHPHLRKLKLADPLKSYAGETAVVTGFGWNLILPVPNEDANLGQKFIGMSFDKLHSAQANVLSNEACSRLFSNPNAFSETYLCAQIVQPQEGEHEGVCCGDSGGPLAYGGDTLIGVLSTGPIGCQENIYPATYTRVSSYLDFIQNAVNGVKDPQILSTPIIMY